ncbi:hypothetical protein Pryu01_01570 [Paraliobacillus ryukyuensis]|uniref:Uncharacterized protein DUF4256 n=1 Tax=Paraliobacillus ryukyuensis TaxID=200904 RepID=A0A366EBZ6_9BACI|nr:DUF4256 domain-containing protein [Paraliobacillus ryukyuensis]RBO99913.1 uncharacterized protein DUF4256 [Paraliobacillus ryukyuensis]
MTEKALSSEQMEILISQLEERFYKNMHRHEGMDWNAIQAKLTNNMEKLWSLYEMERTAGEPDVIGYDNGTSAYIFCDCSKESPKGRRSVCYDHAALESRKKHKPATSAIDMANAMDIDILTEEQYRYLQILESFDTKTSSWIKTPSAIRGLGGALFCDYRFEQVFVYHNGAESYYASRGFRGVLYV